MTAPAGATASAPGAPVLPGPPWAPLAPFEPAGPAGPLTFQLTRRSPFLHLDASRSNPLPGPLFFAQAVIFLGDAAENAPKADAVTAPATDSRHTVATTLA